MAGDRVTAEDLERETDALMVLTEQFARTRDPDQIEELTKLTQEQSTRLQEMADRMGAQHEEDWAERAAQARDDGVDPLRGKVQIQLSPRQRARVQALTGEEVEFVLLDDPTGTMTQGMAAMAPSQVELWAVADVIGRRRQRDASEAAERFERAARARIDAVRAAAQLDIDESEGQP